LRVLMTIILCRSGMFSHVVDLSYALQAQGLAVSLAVRHTDTWERADHQYQRRQIAPLLGLVYKTGPELVAFAREWRPDIIHAHSSLALAGSMQVSKLLDIPLIVTLHGVMPWAKHYWRPLYHATKIIAVGPAQAASVNMPLHKNRLQIIQNGIDTSYFLPKWESEKEATPAGTPEEELAEQGGTERPLRLLWYGRTNGRLSRGAAALDEAVSSLVNQGVEIDAKLVGYAAGVKVKCLQNIGWQDDPRMFLQWGEIAFGHGRALREAMACGNAGFLLAYGYGGLVEASRLQRRFINNDNNVENDGDDDGYVMDAFPQYRFAEPLPEVIAADILRLYADRRKLAALRRQARAIACRYFDLSLMVAKTKKVYQEVLVKQPGWSREA